MNLKDKIKQFPDCSGVYLMKNRAGAIIYVGKATSLKERVSSYFLKNLVSKTALQMTQVFDIEYIETDSPLEALFLETNLIKKYTPKFNIKEKDDKSRIYVHITHEKFPRIYMLRETDLQSIEKKNPILYGPFNSASSVRDALEAIRKVVPFRTCHKMPKKMCLYGYLGLCEAPCESKITVVNYAKRIRLVRDFFEGKKSRVISSLKREMEAASKKTDFEKAAQIRNRLFALEHIKSMFFLHADTKQSVFRRIEGYDISNISGAYATGSMVVFVDSMSEKSEYRKFKIKSPAGVGDTAMLGEVLRRRFKNDWEKPDLILVDGGRGQVNVAIQILRILNLNIPVVGLAKGPDRKKDKLITSQTLPRGDIKLFKEVRDEAHRFAKGYYEKLHRKKLTN